MYVSNLEFSKKLKKQQSKFIKILRLKKYRQQAGAFVVEGAKNVCLLLQSTYTVQLVIGTSEFMATHSALFKGHDLEAFQTDKATLATLGTLKTNNAALAVARIPANLAIAANDNEWGLVLDDIRDPGNLGTIIRIADWYNIPALICSQTTVDLYNPKVLQASMGSFIRVKVYYTYLPDYLKHTSFPISGAFTAGNNVHHTALPTPGLIVIGNESSGISKAVLPYIQQRISIPRYGQAESLNAAMATAIVCDHWKKQERLLYQN